MAVQTITGADQWLVLKDVPNARTGDGLGVVTLEWSHGAVTFVGTIRIQRRPAGADNTAWRDVPEASFSSPTAQLLYLKEHADIRIGCPAGGYTSGQARVEAQ